MNKILATICARGGSKGVPGKNIRPLLGKPLIEWSIKQAQDSGIFDHIVASSDDLDILYAANAAGVNSCIHRPAELATDESGKIPAIVHAVTKTEELAGKFDIIVDLDVTSPLRTPDDILAAIDMLPEHSNVLTGVTSHRSPYFNMVEFDEYGILRLCKPNKGISRRQDAPPCFDMNASIYVWQRDAFMTDPKLFYFNTALYVMPPERSVDIDNELDFEIVEMLMTKR